MKAIRPYLLATMVVITLGLLSSNYATATTLNWKGADWAITGGTASIDGSGQLLLNPTGSSTCQGWVNRLPGDINSNGTPWIQVSWIDTGNPAHKIDMYVQDETKNPSPAFQVGSLWNCTQVLGMIYGAARDEEYLFWSGPPVSPNPDRANIAHTALIGETADGTLYANFDGVWRSSTVLKDHGGAFGFNDVDLRIRGASSGDTITFTNLTYGNDFQPVPLPGTLLLLGSGLVGLAYYRRRKSCKG